ncbi:MAG TPA: SGNH/GDSL hydrolase family protein [Saprospiraceae bacterium]|nr:SGNH/GDSL hydrolase family protein [Saprospiraceae bacterium]
MYSWNILSACRNCLDLTYPLILLACSIPNTASLQSIIVNRNSVQEFDQIPDSYKLAASQLRMLFMDRSVGANINDALSCLASPWASARSACKRYQHRDSAFAVDPKEVFWNGTWDRGNWRYEFWPANCSEDVQCFQDFMANRIDSFDVVGCQFSYLAVTQGSKIADPVSGFFGSTPGRNHASVYARFSAAHPDKKVIWWSTSLARGIGTTESQAFNDQLRDYASKNNIIFFDVADILSHDPSGKPCYDNRDGVAYFDENHPDDGLNIPATCPQYTTETEGGHLGSISAGGIRVAKAFWVLMARIAGWDGITTQTGEHLKADIQISPNPTSGLLNISFPGNAQLDKTKVHIYHLSGTPVYFRRISQSNDGNITRISLSLEELPTGWYYLKLKSGENVKCKGFFLGK